MPVVNTTNSFSNNEQITSTKLNDIMENSSFASGAVVSGQGLEITVGGQMQIKDLDVTTAKIADSSVTQAKLADGAVTQAKTNNSLIPSGSIMAFAMNLVPTGWLHANGSVVSRTTYATLFTAIGTTYGSGDNSTTFTLPDLRGYFVRGSGTNSDGTASGTFGAKQADAFKAHTHNTIQTIDQNGGFDSGAGRPRYGGSVTASSSTGGTETRPKNIAMLYCIKI